MSVSVVLFSNEYYDYHVQICQYQLSSSNEYYDYHVQVCQYQ